MMNSMCGAQSEHKQQPRCKREPGGPLASRRRRRRRRGRTGTASGSGHMAGLAQKGKGFWPAVPALAARLAPPRQQSSTWEQLV
jgi:hypothetical protein